MDGGGLKKMRAEKLLGDRRQTGTDAKAEGKTATCLADNHKTGPNSPQPQRDKSTQLKA